MRRKEFNVDDMEACEAFLRECSHGVLAFAGEGGWPKAVPLNYVYTEGNVYFHGSKKGEKMSGLAKDARSEFVVYEAHAFIPSYFTDPYLACPATQFFRSVRMAGTVEQVEEPAEKARALAALLASMQPEGGHAPIDHEDPKYVSSLRGVAVLRLDIAEMTGKFKFGQNMSAPRREKLIEGLRDRNLPGDEETIGYIREAAPKQS
ncbi:pyridoxamine 5'-phosphate oxidase family protein [Cohnella lubricantis]|uniref:Pyridoxamine 5'-phosphate oxidase family protein n=1 Tax=Cohnella lubricantis TaxID=2163172 RepID=A0A841TI76_9BACL|nr:pyridoxamine 5'-phosphate oxidase family protein [Cohnella lubricantis]MBB6678930.1 pyridoxamine 5'-phosphate oxidase family protein [Cohnella lubricantis]MBP2120370.1 nitroimidazol reductase NimA-like FMN-containing flavoprotein (pyridoxamine 5'-phosphate oxidase superfamily) [Cohnella lubricantis]